MTEEQFYKELKNINIILTDCQKQQFQEYYKLIIDYNSKTNITSITNKEEVYLKHFYDSCLLKEAIDFNNIKNMLDIGSGAGFPGLVLKILFPNLELFLLDSNNKKTAFLKLVIEKLKLKKVIVINERAEIYVKNKREYFDIVTARAVKNLPILIELSIPYVKINGYFIAMKSNCEEELNNSLNGIKELGAKYIETKDFELFNNSGKRSLIIINKIKLTNTKYPRQYNKIVKDPLD